MNIHVWGSNIGSPTQTSNSTDCPPTVLYPTIHHEAGSLNPVAIATGDAHSLLLTDYGDVYSFGHGAEGQLGHSQRSTELLPRLVASLRHETVSAIACGASTSFAVTTSGKVYQWGFVHEATLRPSPSQSHSASLKEYVTSGQLTGLAASQDLEVAIDVDARLAQESSDATASHGSGGGTGPVNLNHASAHRGHAGEQDGPRQLRDIFLASTEMWLLDNDDADVELYEEKMSLGNHKENVKPEFEVFMQQRSEEYKTMMMMGCRRRRCDLPELIPGLSHVRIVSVAAGYAHCMLISDNGQLFGCGYNDRGQLGLGHGINSSQFKEIEYLARKFVLQVSCGQQHTICRAVDRPLAAVDSHQLNEKAQQQYASSSLFPGSEIGANVFVWGNGILGQLGLGLLGTSKGRRLPTLVPSLADQFPNGITDVSTGHHFSVVVTTCGSVYSFGHSEYNQHGSVSCDTRNYYDAFYYFLPRQVTFFDKYDSPVTVVMKSVRCNSNYSLGIDTNGKVYSWGWNVSGVLGRGLGHASTKPTCIDKLGMLAESKFVVAVAAGAKHALALSTTTSNKAADSFQYLLEDSQSSFADCMIFANDHGLETKHYKCHRFILAARSQYFRGYLKAEEAAANENADASASACSGSVVMQRVISIDLTGLPGASNLTVFGLLAFLYLDKIVVPNHKLGALAELANSLSLFQLRDVIVSQIRASEASFGQVTSLQQCDWLTFTGKQQNNDELTQADLASTFSQDMRSAMQSPHRWSNVLFTSSSSKAIAIQAHKSILVQFEYFVGLFASHFQETSQQEQSAEDGSSMLVLSLDGFAEDGIAPEVFHRCLEFAYCGELTSQHLTSTHFEASNCQERVPGQRLVRTNAIQYEDLTEVMSLLVAANRLGHLKLVAICEKELIQNLREPFPENAQNCLEFACEYNFPRLERACLETLRIGNSALLLS